MGCELRPALALSAEQVHGAFVQAFADYLAGPFDLPVERWAGFLGRQCVDLSLSRVAMADGSVVAFALVSRRAGGSRWRLATMGALPAARGSGAAQALLDDWIERARASGVDGLELEAFAQNERALRLYLGRGFAVVHELHGYEGVIASDADSAAEPPGDEVDPADAFAWLDDAERRLVDLPLQVTAASLAALPGQMRAWRRGTAQLIVGANARGAVSVHSLVDTDPEQRDAQALVEALPHRFAGRRLLVPPLQRLDVGGRALRRAGYGAQPLHQVMMGRGIGRSR